MKNLIFVFIAASIFVFSSCSKENLDLPATEKLEIVAAKTISAGATDNPQALLPQTDGVYTAQSTTIRLQVSELSSTETTNTYGVNFTGNYDFSSFTLKDNQTLTFTNSLNKGFVVDSYIGSNCSLSITFLKGNHVLTGLRLEVAQEIVVEDHIIN